MTSARWFGGILLAIAAGLAPQLAAQLQTDVPPPVAGAQPVTVEHVKVHGTALEGNSEGNSVDRDVFVFLPASYAQEKSRRYPVVYALHGYSIGAEQWTREIHVPQTIEGAFAQGAKEMIVVLPDSKSCTTVPCIRVPSPPAISSSLLRAIWSHTSMRITVRFQIARAEDSWVTRWEGAQLIELRSNPFTDSRDVVEVVPKSGDPSFA